MGQPSLNFAPKFKKKEVYYVSRRLLVEIEKAEFIIFQDEDGNDMYYEENGEEYFACQVWYHLGKILETENVESYRVHLPETLVRT